MHVQTHLMSGWCAANLLPFTARERLFCMIAATASDVDGLGIVLGERVYQEYHHVVGHNLLFAILLAAVLTIFSRRRILAFLTYVALVHLHLLADYYGSGPGWGIPYLWPFSEELHVSARGWGFHSWQNLTAAGLMLVGTLVIVDRCGRTPLEALMPKLDRQLVDAWQRRVRGKSESLPS